MLHLRRVSVDRLELTIKGAGFEPFQLTRTPIGAAPLGNFDATRRYRRAADRPTNLEMSAMFEADQNDRRAAEIDWTVVGPADDARRTRTEELLAAGALQSAEDFFHAAFVFQHGSTSNDYLKAHLLATIAIARGKPDATWIAAATLDRYLRSIGQPQVLGTQFSWKTGQPVTQEPYDRSLLTDPLRRALNVPALAEQDEQRLSMEAKRTGSRTPD